MSIPLNTMTTPEFLQEARLHAHFVKAALVRGVFSSVIGVDEVDTHANPVVYKADFTDPRILAFVDKFYIPRMKDVLVEADRREMITAVKTLFSPQGVYAVQLGTVSAFDFNEITNIIYPAKAKTVEISNIIPFRLPQANHL